MWLLDAKLWTEIRMVKFDYLRCFQVIRKNEVWNKIYDTTYRCVYANACMHAHTHTHKNQDIPCESSLVFFHKELQKLVHIR